MSSQRRYMSLLESFVSVAVGYVLTVAVQVYLFPVFGIIVPVGEAMFISVFLVGVAFIKNYTIRRFFVFVHERSLG